MPVSTINRPMTSATARYADSLRLSVAPMMDWTDRHCRFFLRLLSKHALLYTEMVTTGAILHGDHERFLRHDEAEHPLALQLGGNTRNVFADKQGHWRYALTDADITAPAETIAIADTLGCSYDRKVLNVGNYVIDPPLPSNRGSRPQSPADGFYGAPGTSECSGAAGCRALPAERHSKMVTVGFADGHAKAMRLTTLDDFNRDGIADNGWWNGHGDPTRR